MIKLTDILKEGTTPVRDNITDDEGKKGLITFTKILGKDWKPDRYNLYNFKSGDRTIQILCKYAYDKETGIWINISYTDKSVQIYSYASTGSSNRPKFDFVDKGVNFTPDQLQNPYKVVLNYKNKILDLANKAAERTSAASKQMHQWYLDGGKAD